MGGERGGRVDASDIITQIFALALAISVHESAHAWAALKCGDDTAAREGRISLNPMDHVDPVGTVLVPLALILTNAPFLFGWAKPVGYYPSRTRDPRLAERYISAAGPVSNLLLAALIGLLFRLYVGFDLHHSLSGETAVTLARLLVICVVTNVGLALFNLVPVPPLDGFGIVKSFASHEQGMRLEIWSRQYGFLLLVALLYFDAFRFLHYLMQPLLGLMLGR